MLCEVVSPGGGRDSTEGILQYSNIFFVPTQYICYATGTIYTAHEFKTNARLREAIQACLVCLKKITKYMSDLSCKLSVLQIQIQIGCSVVILPYSISLGFKVANVTISM